MLVTQPYRLSLSEHLDATHDLIDLQYHFFADGLLRVFFIIWNHRYSIAIVFDALDSTQVVGGYDGVYFATDETVFRVVYLFDGNDVTVGDSWCHRVTTGIAPAVTLVVWLPVNMIVGLGGLVVCQQIIPHGKVNIVIWYTYAYII